MYEIISEPRSRELYLPSSLASFSSWLFLLYTGYLHGADLGVFFEKSQPPLSVLFAFSVCVLGLGLTALLSYLLCVRSWLNVCHTYLAAANLALAAEIFVLFSTFPLRLALCLGLMLANVVLLCLLWEVLAFGSFPFPVNHQISRFLTGFYVGVSIVLTSLMLVDSLRLYFEVSEWHLIITRWILVLTAQVFAIFAVWQREGLEGIKGLAGFALVSFAADLGFLIHVSLP